MSYNFKQKTKINESSSKPKDNPNKIIEVKIQVLILPGTNKKEEIIRA